MFIGDKDIATTKKTLFFSYIPKKRKCLILVKFVSVIILTFSHLSSQISESYPAISP